MMLNELRVEIDRFHFWFIFGVLTCVFFIKFNIPQINLDDDFFEFWLIFERVRNPLFLRIFDFWCPFAIELLNEMIILWPNSIKVLGWAWNLTSTGGTICPPIISAARLCTRSVVNESEKIILLKLSYLTLGQLSSISWSRSHEKNLYKAIWTKLDPVLEGNSAIFNRFSTTF